MIAACYMDKGLHEQGAEWYARALAAPGLARDTELACATSSGGRRRRRGNTGGRPRELQRGSHDQPGVSRRRRPGVQAPFQLPQGKTSGQRGVPGGHPGRRVATSRWRPGSAVPVRIRWWRRRASSAAMARVMAGGWSSPSRAAAASRHGPPPETPDDALRRQAVGDPEVPAVGEPDAVRRWAAPGPASASGSARRRRRRASAPASSSSSLGAGRSSLGAITSRSVSPGRLLIVHRRGSAGGRRLARSSGCWLTISMPVSGTRSRTTPRALTSSTRRGGSRTR